jgi:hypothetical protein
MKRVMKRECTRTLKPGIRLSAAALLALTACGETGLTQQEAPRQEAAEANGECQVQPPFNPNFEPELEWEWTDSPILPAYNNVMMTPVVVEVNGDGIPDVVFSSHPAANYDTGVLRAISGANGQELWTVTDPALRVRGAASLGAADIDGDGLVEICAIPESGTGMLCFENTGVLKFRTTLPTNEWGSVSFADLDGDGTVEILNGNHVFTSTGALKWVGVDGMGGQGVGPISFAADIDGDGLQEVVNDRAIYRHDGTLKCRHLGIGHGLAGVGNFDSDSRGEVVVVSNGSVYLMDDDCTLRWGQALPGGGAGGAPNIADFDNDGQPEIGVAGASRYTVFETNGTVKWTSITQDGSSNRTGSSTFDFEGDGRAEAVYADELHLRIYDGATGAVRFQVPNSSCTTYENPVIVDVDGDDNAEIVVAANTTCGFGPFHGIRVFRDRKDGWVNTRSIWNQHAYSVTNVNDDGTIPAHPATNWLTPGLNTFRSNSQGTGVTSPFAAADVTVTEVTSACDRTSGTLRLNARVSNQGDAAVSAGMRVAFYQGNPSAGGTLLGVATLPAVLSAGNSAVATLVLASAPGGTAEVWAVADDDGTGTGRETECMETNNGGSAPVSLSCSTNLPPVAVCRDVTLSASAVTCSAPASVDNGSHDPDNQPAALTVTQSPAGPFVPGTHSVTLTVSDGQSSDSCTATVTVVDTTAPVIACPAERIVEATGPEGAFVTPAEATVSDACGAAVSGPSAGTYPQGTTAVTYTATDAAGNSASCTTAIHVVAADTTPPKFTMCGMPRYTSAALIKACGWATPQSGGVAVSTVLLTVDGGAPVRLTPEVSGGFVFKWLDLAEGHHTITLTAIGVDGGIASQSMAVSVDRTAPIVRILSPVPGAPQPFVVDVVSEVTDLTPVRVTANWVSSTDVDAGTSLATNTVTFSGSGYNSVLLQATDAAGNTSEQVIQILVQ